MIPAGVLCYRDDTGRTQAEKLAQRLRWFRGRPALGTFLVMFAIVNVAYFVLRRRVRRHPRTRAATSVACPWPYPGSQGVRPARATTSEKGHPAPTSRATGTPG